MSTLASGQIVADKYRLLGYVGSGGVADVWAAQHVELHRSFALKFIHASQARNPQLWERFERDGKTLAGCQSRHLVRVYDWQPAKYGEYDPFIVMDLLPGRSLRQRLEERTPMSAAELRWIMEDVASGLRLVHDRGIVHRDLKPENIFLMPGNGGQYATVLDSGVAMIEDRAATGLSRSRTAPACYLSPEYLQNPRSIDTRTDIWSLGMIAFECLLRTLPFAGERRDTTVAKILSGEPLPEPSTLAQVPPGFDAWFQRACMHDRDKRFQTIGLAIEALRQVCKARSDVTNLLDLQRDEIERQVDGFRQEIDRLSKLVIDLEAKHASLQTRCTRTCDELKVAMRLLDEVQPAASEPLSAQVL